MSKVEQLKKEGNDLFCGEKYFDAYNTYTKAIEICPKENKYLLSQLKTILSATALILEKPLEAINLASEAIELDPKNYKAFIRRGNAYAESLSWEDAYNDYNSASQLEPSIKYFHDRMEYAKKMMSLKKQFTDTPKPNQLPKIEPEAPPSQPQRQPPYQQQQQQQQQPIRQSTPPPPQQQQESAQQQAQQSEYTEDQIKTIMRDMLNDKRPPEGEVAKIIRKATDIHQKLPNVTKINVKSIRIVGDTHGQYQDVLNIFDTFGYPSDDNPYLFNGDYVDRGSMSCEILIALMLWKLYNPNCIFINRGNHETSYMNNVYGFENECVSKYSRSLYDMFLRFFCSLPIAYIVNDKIFVVHGGLPEDPRASIDAIQRAPRSSPSPETGIIADLLWADPMYGNGYKPSPRGVAAEFGADVTSRFLNNNNLDLLVRSHQVQQEGYGVMHAGKCITVFSAPNYTGFAGNKGAILHITFNANGTTASQKFETFTAKPIPPKYRPLMYQSLSFR